MRTSVKMYLITIQGWKISSQACLTFKTYRYQLLYCVNLGLRHLGVSFVHQISCIWSRFINPKYSSHVVSMLISAPQSVSNLNWDVINDSDFKAWVRYFGMPCSGPDTFTSPFTKSWSLVISLIDWYLKVSHEKSTWFARLTRQDRVAFAWPPKNEGKSAWDCTGIFHRQ